MFRLNRNSRPQRTVADIKVRRQQLEALVDIAESYEGGIFKRIEELRETANTIRMKAPVFGDANPWLFRWLGSTDEFLCAMAGALHPLDLSRHRGGVQWYAGIFPMPELGPPETLYGTIGSADRLRTKPTPRFWRRVNAGDRDYVPIADQQRAIEDHQAETVAQAHRAADALGALVTALEQDGHIAVSVPTTDAMAHVLPEAITAPAAPRKTFDEMRRNVIGADIAQLLAGATHADAMSEYARAQGLHKQADEHHALAAALRARAATRAEDLSP